MLWIKYSGFLCATCGIVFSHDEGEKGFFSDIALILLRICRCSGSSFAMPHNLPFFICSLALSSSLSLFPSLFVCVFVCLRACVVLPSEDTLDLLDSFFSNLFDLLCSRTDFLRENTRILVSTRLDPSLLRLCPFRLFLLFLPE